MTKRQRARRAEAAIQADGEVGRAAAAVEELKPVAWTAAKGFHYSPEGAYYKRDAVDRLLRLVGLR